MKKEVPLSGGQVNSDAPTTNYGQLRDLNKDKSARHATDQFLRGFGFKVFSRPNSNPDDSIWIREERIYTYEEAKELAKHLQRNVMKG